ncbi:hypothetical protein LINPERHAP1_LOCUS37853 [Linum perenne]
MNSAGRKEPPRRRVVAGEHLRRFARWRGVEPI